MIKIREKNYTKLGIEDEDFRRKILDLHRKLSDVDEDSAQALITGENDKTTIHRVGSIEEMRNEKKIEDLSGTMSEETREANEILARHEELESIARRNERMSSSGDSSLDKELEPDPARKYTNERRPSTEKRRLRKLDLELERRRNIEQLRRRSERLEDVAEEETTDESSGPGGRGGGTRETSILTRLRIRRRSIKLLGFLSGKSADRSQEERAARLLKMYMPEKSGTSSHSGGNKPQNTIAIHHNSRDRRFWKLRSRRKSNSA